MTPLAIVIVAAIAGLVLGSALVPGAPVFALPIVAVLIVVLGLTELRRRRSGTESVRELRRQAKAEPVEFSARDKQTLVDS
jgi:type III secretory pathway component EscV